MMIIFCLVYSKAVKILDQTFMQVPTIPIYRVLNSQGKVINPDHDPGFEKEDLVEMYKVMVKTSIMDRILYQSQRQGEFHHNFVSIHGTAVISFIRVYNSVCFNLLLKRVEWKINVSVFEYL